MSSPLVFVHIPKCAGTSLRTALEGNFPREKIAHYYVPQRNDFKGGVKAFDFASGHFALSFAEKHAPDGRYVTFLRNPLDRLESQYFYELRYGAVTKSQTKLAPADAMKTWRHTYFDNCITRYLSGAWHDVPFGEMTEDHAVQAIANLRKFEFVGFQETFSSDIPALSRLLGIPLNVRNENRRKPGKHFTVEDVTRCWNLMRCDYLVYEAARIMRPS